MTTGAPRLPVLRTVAKVLAFRISREELLGLERRHLLFGLICTWVVGMGRYWDDPGAHLLQHLGLGSVVYVFVLSVLLWKVLRPMGVEDWTYRRVLTFVTLTSPPALLYAIPVERFMHLESAREANLLFLLAVAIWRVALFMFLVRRLGRLHWPGVVVGTLLPLTLIITTLTILNLERAVLDVMRGLRPDEGTANDSAYAVLTFLTVLSAAAFIPLLGAWSVVVWIRRRHQARARAMTQEAVEDAPPSSQSGG